jgi:peptide/nickel transport system ATP-binding protein
MLHVDNVSFRYPNRPWLFRNLSLTIDKGEIVGMYGKSGIGKSTLAKIIAGYIKPLQGEIRICNNKLTGEKIYPVQLIWQHAELVINPSWQMKKILAESPYLSEEMLSRLGIQSSWLSKYPHELSGGELQRFNIARALGTDAPFYIADEITSMFDAISQAQIWHSLLQEVEQQQKGMLVISHNQKLLEKICHRIVHFSDLTMANRD